ncbi:MAG: aminoglycoside phosphotransferase family protein [Candidatus Latescibacterota bacterium]|nr:MAG: aminoglycoside phosphotransferase family protein [Candidatus Latescibacterota bacterium]
MGTHVGPGMTMGAPIKAFLRRAKWLLRGKKPPRAVRGVPDGLSFETLSKLCTDHRGDPLERVSHFHLSGWKASGAYRLVLKLRSGATWQLVYKNAVYSRSQIPALESFPVRPGPPEYAVYHANPGPLREYLPVVLLCEEVEEDRHYHYIFEDLGRDYRGPSDERTTIGLAATLNTFHAAMSESTTAFEKDCLLRYDREFSTSVYDYARTNLERYAEVVPGEAISKVIALWPRILDVGLGDDTFDASLIQPIHGDFNRSNLFLHRNDPRKLKMVDWEWAGWGLPHADLASLLKKISDAVESEALQVYARENPQLSPHEHVRIYRSCQLERSLIDAAFLAVQAVDGPGETRLDLARHIEGSLHAAIRALDMV